MNIAFFGLPLAALLLQGDGHHLQSALLSRPGLPGTRRLRRSMAPGTVWIRGEIDQGDLTRRLRARPPDLVVSWFWTRKLPLSVVKTARLGAIGAHPSLLPRHRGPDPYWAAIDQGDSTTGVTVHRIDADYDTGAILAQRELAIDPAWNAWQLARRLDRPSLALLREVAGKLARGDRIAEQVQDEARATWAPEPTAADCALHWADTTERLLRRIRALSPAPGAFTEIGDQIVTILEARFAREFPRALEPGEAAVLSDVAVVRTADHAIELLAGELEDQALDQAALARLVTRAREKMIR